ncbi:MAG: aspartate aminotransferase family protein [Pseudomonadota bacterium]
MSHLMQNYGRLPVSFVSGQGASVRDSAGREYLDALCGLAVTGLGHAHEGVTRALQAQASALLHTSNLYQVPEQERLATRLCEVSGMDRVFFCNSGAEANEAAIKLARRWGNSLEQPRGTIIVMEGSFHGRTMATLTATGNRKAQAGFEPLLKGFVRAPYDDIAAIEQIARNNTDVVAVLLEPVQGEGGIAVPSDDYLPALRRICDEQNWLLMLDEVQTGNGRTGRFFAYQHAQILPDVVTTAKGLGNGVPIGACLASGTAAEVLTPGTHGSTFGGNPLVCAAGNAVLDALEDGTLMARAAELGERIRDALRARLKGNNRVREIRGKGLMIGIELTSPASGLVQQALERGLLINVTADSVVRLLPPLILTDEQANAVSAAVADLIEDQ